MPCGLRVLHLKFEPKLSIESYGFTVDLEELTIKTVVNDTVRAYSINPFGNLPTFPDNPFTPGRRVAPLVIDMDGDGVETIALANSNAFFDLNLDGLSERVGWVGVDDALLAHDINGNGRIDDKSELFGDWGTHADGFAALASHDLNGDGRIDALDPVFGQLTVWFDGDGDGWTDDGELRTLARPHPADRPLVGGSSRTRATRLRAPRLRTRRRNRADRPTACRCSSMFPDLVPPS